MEETEEVKDKAKDFNNRIKEISDKIGLTDKQIIISIDPKDNIKLGGSLERNSVFVVKIKDEKEDITHVVIDKDINIIASIDKNGKIELSDEEKKKWEQFIGTKGNQRPDQKERYDFDKEYYLKEYDCAKDEKPKENVYSEESADLKKDVESGIPDDPKNKAAEALEIKETAIISMIKIEDRETFGQAINKKLHADAYIVRYGNNKTKIMQVDSKGKLTELTGLESNEFNSEVLEQLNMNNAKQNQKIRAGDLTTIKTEDNKCNYVVVREHDSKNGIVIVNTTNQTKMYTFDDEGKEDLKEIKTAIQYEVENKTETKKENEREEEKNKQEDEEEQGRVPWDEYRKRY